MMRPFLPLSTSARLILLPGEFSMTSAEGSESPGLTMAAAAGVREKWRAAARVLATKRADEREAAERARSIDVFWGKEAEGERSVGRGEVEMFKYVHGYTATVTVTALHYTTYTRVEPFRGKQWKAQHSTAQHAIWAAIGAGAIAEGEAGRGGAGP